MLPDTMHHVSHLLKRFIVIRLITKPAASSIDNHEVDLLRTSCALLADEEAVARGSP